MTADGVVRRIGWGIYDYPRVNERLGIRVAPDPAEVAEAIARKSGPELAPSGAVAANQLGLRMQVPAKLHFLTNSPSKTVKVGNQTFVFKRVAPKDFAAERTLAAATLRALKHLGREAAQDQAVVERLRARLSEHDKRELLRFAAYGSDWLRAVARQIAEDVG
ncbi:MAG: DUF6088 family protein [Planctomycetota bacterium]